MANSTLITDYLGRGTHAARPVTPPISGIALAVYYETDTTQTFIWTGSAWAQIINTGISGASILAYGVALPTAAAGNRGQFYMQQGNGTTVPDRVYISRERADGSFVWTRFQGRTKEIKMASADFTPTAVGVDNGGIYIVPWDGDENGAIAVTWTVVSATFRTETQSSAGTTSVKIQKYTGIGNFALTAYLNATTVDIAVSTNEPATNPAFSQFVGSTVASGDKLRAEYTSLGTSAAGFTLILSLRES